MPGNKGDKYKIESGTTDGTAILSHSRYGRQVWVRGRLRKDCRCALSRRRLRAGETAWHPITNQRNRMERIGEQAMRRQMEEIWKKIIRNHFA